MYRIRVFLLATICFFYLTLYNGHLPRFHHGMTAHDPEGQALGKDCPRGTVAVAADTHSTASSSLMKISHCNYHL